MIGTTISHYRITDRLGAGGMGVVYRAEDVHLHRMAALKFLHTSDDLQRLLREAQAAGALSHPNICTVYEVNPEGGFIAMEYVEGRTLSKLIDGRPLRMDFAMDLARQIGDGLRAAHDKGIVHRDIKSGNIIVTESGEAKILDFGLARRDGQTAITGEGLVAGTPGYMAPEQLRGEQTDRRTDIWAFGAVLHEMLTGRPPVGPVGELPPSLERVVVKALAASPDDRYQHIEDLIVDLPGASRRPAASTEERPRNYSRRLWAAAAVASLAVLVAGWTVFRSMRVESARAELREARRISDLGQGLEAARRMRGLRTVLEGDPEFELYWKDYTFPYSVKTHPPGADVYIKDLLKPGDAWEYLGKSPLESLRKPHGTLRVRFTLEGYQTAEIAMDNGANLTLRALGKSPDGMLYVPARADIRFSGKRAGAFWIDRYEVTNEQFKRFVDAGGYEDEKYWKEPFEKDGRPLTWKQAMTEFRDATGRPGPSTWELGNYPKDQARYPVGGVSWYEAAAYAEFAGKQLPSIFHFYAAAGAWTSAEVLQTSNFYAKGPAEVTSDIGLNGLGASAMAGNVREWCWNRKGLERFAAGGAWNEPPYSYTRVDISRPPFDRAETTGFRCIKAIDPVDPDLLAPDPATVRDYTRERPVGNAEFDSFLRLYDYDVTEPKTTLEFTKDESDWRLEKVTYQASYRGERIPAYLFLPKNTVQPYQTVVYLPTLNAMFQPTSETLEMGFIRFLIQSGRAVLYPVYKGMYERRVSTPTPISTRDRNVEMIKDIRSSVDYLKTRPDINSQKLAFYGVSFGGIYGTVATAVEKRFQASILALGGYFDGPAELPETDSLNFAPRVRVPTLMVSGRDDPLFPVETTQIPLFRDLGVPAEHKRHVLLDGGHVPRRMQDLIREVLNWLDKYLGPVELRKVNR